MAAERIDAIQLRVSIEKHSQIEETFRGVPMFLIRIFQGHSLRSPSVAFPTSANAFHPISPFRTLCVGSRTTFVKDPDNPKLTWAA
jgi:hypothetical protein